jgi:hypothetical protein
MRACAAASIAANYAVGPGRAASAKRGPGHVVHRKRYARDPLSWTRSERWIGHVLSGGQASRVRSARGWPSAPGRVAAAATRDAMRRVVLGVSAGAVQASAHSLSFGLMDLADQAFHRHALEASTVMTTGIRSLIEEAVGAGKLTRCDAGRLASAVHATMIGSELRWAVSREGSVVRWVERDLRTVLGPYEIARGRHAMRKRRMTP